MPSSTWIIITFSGMNAFDDEHSSQYNSHIVNRIVEIFQNADLFDWLSFLVWPFTVISLHYHLWPKFTSWIENRRKNRLDKLLSYELPQLENAHKFLNLPINAALAQFAHGLFWTLVLLSFWFILLYLRIPLKMNSVCG